MRPENVFMFTAKVPLLNVSYKPQKISPKSQGTVRQLLHEKIRDAYIHPQFVTDVVKPLQVEQLFDQEVRTRFMLCDRTSCGLQLFSYWLKVFSGISYISILFVPVQSSGMLRLRCLY
jgi:hypothetical protein